mgnify:CR=1 FL=1
MNSYIPIHNFVVSNFVVLEINFLFELGSIVICSGDQAQNNILNVYKAPDCAHQNYLPPAIAANLYISTSSH